MAAAGKRRRGGGADVCSGAHPEAMQKGKEK